MWHGIDADMTTPKGTTTGSELAGMTNAIPLGRLETPLDVAGQSLVVDGGTWFS
jgi:hypothetical protein